MEYVEPEIHLVAHTALNTEGVADMLADLGAEGWSTDAHHDSDELAELAGRLCYMSFGTGLNPNVTRVREGNETYLGSVLDSAHGSVLEHASATFVITGLSRVATHEMVRHRPGKAYSQESLRYVRLDNLKFKKPAAFEADFLGQVYDAVDWDAANIRVPPKDEWVHHRATMLKTRGAELLGKMEALQQDMAEYLGMDHIKDFAVKKKLTSAMRRFAPIGLGTKLMATGNMRAWRFEIAQRTSEHAEEEVRGIYFRIFEKLMCDVAPNCLQDAIVETVDGMPRVTFENHKV